MKKEEELKLFEQYINSIKGCSPLEMTCLATVADVFNRSTNDKVVSSVLDIIKKESLAKEGTKVEKEYADLFLKQEGLESFCALFAILFGEIVQNEIKKRLKELFNNFEKDFNYKVTDYIDNTIDAYIKDEDPISQTIVALLASLKAQIDATMVKKISDTKFENLKERMLSDIKEVSKKAVNKKTINKKKETDKK